MILSIDLRAIDLMAFPKICPSRVEFDGQNTWAHQSYDSAHHCTCLIAAFKNLFHV